MPFVPTMIPTRRQFLRQAGAVALGFTGLHTLFGMGCASSPRTDAIPYGFGPLRPDPEKILDLPDGFTYRILSRAGDPMDDGLFVPGRPDGMAAFEGPNGLTVLVRNHETNVGAGDGAFGPGNRLLDRVPAEKLYDRARGEVTCLGGTTTLVFDTRTGRVERQFLSLAGTLRNCAGGPTPWNTWITCEETVQRADEHCLRDHGYNFEVPATATPALADPVPLTAMGRFNHEAVAVDPASGIVYQTEDRHDGLLYRYIPNEPGRLAAGGRLQALAVLDRPSLDTRNWDERLVPAGTTLEVRWIDLEDIEAPEDDLRLRGYEAGAARFARGEGMWYGRDAIYFACTNGGSARKGQIWRYVPSPDEGRPGETQRPGRLQLFVEPNDGGLIDNADNLTVAPWGDLIVCEDGSGEQFLVGITPAGEIYKFARNAVNDSEFAGATFSPDGTTLFVNIQTAGVTLAISGPWRRA